MQASATKSSDRRLHWCLGFALLAHALLVAPAMINFSCRHDRPMGLPGGSGDKIAKGTPQGMMGATGKDGGGQKKKETRTVVLNPQMEIASSALAAQKQRSRRRFIERYSADGLRALLLSRDDGTVRADAAEQAQAAVDSVGADGTGQPGALGLPQGEGTGATAAGSPHGTRIGAKLWLYRVKYSSGDWDANPKALPALLREVKLAQVVTAVGGEEILRLSDLPKHRGEFIPALLFMTGTGAINTTDAERAALRDYLTGGGFLVADSSGGSFEQQFTRFMAQVLPGKSFRAIEFDHDVYRGRFMRYKLENGCPIYRDHGSQQARGIFDETGRMMVFFSPGDLGSAWAVVDLGKKRGAVEAAFQMGTNLVTYSLQTVRDNRK